MEQEKGPVPQALFVNEAYLHSQVPESYCTNTCVAVKQENNEPCSQLPSLEIKTEEESVDGLSSQTCEEAVSSNGSTQMMHQLVSDRLVACLTDNLVINDLEEKVLNQVTSTDCYEIKVESDGEDDIPFSSACPMSSVDKMPSELFACKQKNLPDTKLNSGDPTDSDIDVKKSSSKKDCRMTRLSKRGRGRLEQQLTTITSEVGVGKFSKSSRRCERGEQPNKHRQRTTDDETHVCNKTSHSTETCVSVRLNVGDKYCMSDIGHAGFDDDSRLLLHTKTHPGETKTYKCTLCDREFLQSCSLESHMIVHRDVKSYRCTICGKAFNENAKLNYHLRIHNKEKTYVCNVCDSAFLYKYQLTKHIGIHTGQKPYKCSVCGDTFIWKAEQTQHMRIHKKMYECTVCDSVYFNSAHLKKHIKNVHTAGEKIYKCIVCNMGFMRTYQLKRHLTTHKVTDEKAFKCSQCGMAFLKIYKLADHMRTHTHNVVFECTHCDKSFIQITHLKQHMKVHRVSKNKQFEFEKMKYL